MGRMRSKPYSTMEQRFGRVLPPPLTVPNGTARTKGEAHVQALSDDQGHADARRHYLEGEARRRRAGLGD